MNDRSAETISSILAVEKKPSIHDKSIIMDIQGVDLLDSVSQSGNIHNASGI